MVIPARNEADGIGETIGSLLRQDYPGAFTIILVDDDSSDGTADVARQAAAATAAPRDRLKVIAGRPLPRGWTGKLWAVKQGVEAAQAATHPPDYLLLIRCRHRLRARTSAAAGRARRMPTSSC